GGGEGEPAGGTVPADQGQLEGELVDPVGGAEIAQPALPHQGPEGGLDGGGQTGGHQPGIADVDVAPGPLLVDEAGQLRSEIGGGEVGSLQHPVHEGADVGAAG